MGGIVGLAGCSGGSGDDGGTTDTATATPESTPTETAVPTSTPIPTPEEDTREVQGKYMAAVSSDAQSLNWLQIADSTSGSYIGLALDGAWAIDNNQEVFPLWAEPSTDDGITYTITLRENLMWGKDYGQMTAEDWVYMIKNVFQAPDNWAGYPSADDWFGTNPESDETEPIPVRKTGEFTFEIELFQVDPAWPFKPVMWGQNAMPKKLLQKYVPDKDAEGLKQDEDVNTLGYAGNLGPYSYENWERESQFRTVRNDEYYLREVDSLPEEWGEAPYFEEYLYKVIKEESARLGALEAGDITVAGIPPSKAQKFKENEDINLVVQPQPYVSVLAYNMRANGWAPFRVKGVRQALAHAVDKQALSKGVYRGYANVAQTMQPKWSKWYNAKTVKNYGVGDRYGPEITRKKLSKALANSEYSDYTYDGDKLVDPDGKQVTLTLFFDAGQNTEKTTAEFVAQEFKKNAGINVEIKSTSSFIAKYAHNSPDNFDSDGDGDKKDEEVPWSGGYFNGGPRTMSTSPEAWDMSVNLGFNTYPYTPSSSDVFFYEKSTINYYGYVPERDIKSVYDEASKTADEEKRKELFGKAFGWINEEQPFGFLVMQSDVIGYQDEVVGPTPEFASGWDYQTWYFKDE